jgi:pimeloyl-ACP methyl ester carboxylesterase
MSKKYLHPVIYFLIVFILIISCEDNQPLITKGGPHTIVDLKDSPYSNLESYSYTASAKILQSLVKDNNLDYLLPFITYDVSVHHITYSTTYKDSVIIGSGAICIPISEEKSSLLSFQHGTLFYDKYTPSEFKDLSAWGMELIASSGYITFIPDYIGYGSTKEIVHPYHIYIPTVNAVIDMIIEGKRFLRQNQIDFDTSGIFLAGFSEGGYATFAVQKELETHPELNISIIASSPGAGAYELEKMFDLTTQNDYYPQPGYMGLALLAYNQYYWNNPLDNYFNPEYIDNIETLLDGTHTESEIHSDLPDYLSELLAPDFLEDFHNNPDNSFRTVLKENSLNNWIVKSPTRLIHGTNDKTVPFPVAQKTYNDLITLGANPDNLTLQTFDGGHNDTRYMVLMLEWFDSMKY